MSKRPLPSDETEGFDLLADDVQFKRQLRDRLQSQTSINVSTFCQELKTGMPSNSDWASLMRVLTVEDDTTELDQVKQAFWTSPPEEKRFDDYVWVCATWNLDYPWTTFSNAVLTQLHKWLPRFRALTLKIWSIIDNQYVPTSTFGLRESIANPHDKFMATLRQYLADFPETNMLMSGSYILQQTSQADWKSNDIDIYVYDKCPELLMTRIFGFKVEIPKNSQAIRVVVTDTYTFQLIFVDTPQPQLLINGFDFMVLQQYYDLRTRQLMIRPAAAWEMTTKQMNILEDRTTYFKRISKYESRGYTFPVTWRKKHERIRFHDILLTQSYPVIERYEDDGIVPWHVRGRSSSTGYDGKEHFWTCFEHLCDVSYARAVSHMTRVRLFAYVNGVQEVYYQHAGYKSKVHIITLRHCKFAQDLLRAHDYQQYWERDIPRDSPDQDSIQMQYYSGSSRSELPTVPGLYMLVIHMHLFEGGMLFAPGKRHLDLKPWAFVDKRERKTLKHPVIEYCRLIEPTVDS